jgi:hypothetical protein
MSEDKQAGICIICILVLFILFAGLKIYSIFFEEDKTIPSEEQKPQVQNVKTEVLTHVIRCTTYVNDTCTEYRVYNIVRE